MTEERERPEREKEREREERRREADRRRRKRDREKPTAVVVITKKADELLEGVKESDLPRPDKKTFEEKLGDVKEKAETRERKKNLIEELMEVIELFLELGKIEDEIAETKKTEIWKELKKRTKGLQEGLRRGRLDKKEVNKQVEGLLDEIEDREEISDRELQNMIGRLIEDFGREIEEGAVGAESLLDLAEKVRGGEALTPEEEEAFRLLQRFGQRTFTPQELRLLDKYSTDEWSEVKEQAREVVEEKVNRIFEVIDTNPEADWRQAMTIQDQFDLSVIHRKLLDMGEWGQQLSRKLMSENNLRRYLFTLNYGIEKGGFKPDKLQDNMSGFTTDLREALFNIEGASTAARLWETGFEKLLMHYDYVPYELVAYKDGRSVLADWVKERFKKHLEGERQRLGLDKEKFWKRWPDWKINRAISVGKGNGLVTLRLVEITAKGKLPLEGQGMYSPWAEDYVRAANPTYHLYSKFWQGYPAQAMLQYFWLTGEKPPKGLSTQQYLDLIKEKAGRAKELKKGGKRLIDKINFLGAGGPWTRSSWRGILAGGLIPGKTAEKLQHLGTNLALILLKERLGEDRKAEWENEVRNVWTKALKRDALQIIRETEIFDEPLKQLLEEIMGKDYDKTYFEQIAEFSPDERMKHLVLLDFLRRTEPNWKTKWKEEFVYTPKTKRWKRMPLLKKKDEFLDEIEDQYLLAREAMVSEIERTGKDVEFDTGQLSDEVKAYLRSIEKITKLKFGPRDKDTILESLVEKTLTKEEKGGGFPLGLGNSDIAWKLLGFSEEGQQALHRRYRDFGDAATAVNMIIPMLWKFGEYQKNPLKFVEDAKTLYVQITGYDPNIASEVCENLLEGFLRVSDGDLGIKYLPFPLDRLYDMFVRSSYAEQVLGEGAQSFTAIDKRNLIKHFRELGMLATADDMGGHDKERELFRRLGATRWHTFKEFLFRYGPFGIGFIFWQIWKEYEEKVEQSLK